MFTRYRELGEAFRSAKCNIGSLMTDAEREQLEDQALGNIHRAKIAVARERQRANALADGFATLARMLQTDPTNISVESYRTAEWFSADYLAAVVGAIETANVSFSDAVARAREIDLAVDDDG